MQRFLSSRLADTLKHEKLAKKNLLTKKPRSALKINFHRQRQQNIFPLLADESLAGKFNIFFLLFRASSPGEGKADHFRQ
jgi:hypothetical protein